MINLHLTCLLLIIIVSDTFTYNLSPAANYRFKPPTTPGTSLFGMSIVLKKVELIVGAPKMGSSTELESGAIFKCPISSRGYCHEYNVQERHFSPNLIKEKQFLGYSMDINDKFVTCASNLKMNRSADYYLHGSCYWSPSNSEETIQINALKDLEQQLVETEYGIKTYYYMFGQLGFSVHVSDNGEEILMGAPGVYNWKGSVVRYRKAESIETGRERRQISEYDYVSNVINPGLSAVQNDSYLGYSVASGYFDSTNPNKLLYLASAPQGNDQSGIVYLFEYARKGTENVMKTLNRFETDQMGDYFGYTLVVEDVNGDGMPDFLVGAPMYSLEMMHDNGAVYVYLNKGSLNFNKQAKLTGSSEVSGRFGTAIGKIGDIDLDGYNDIAVGAPYENDGAVYIYRGSSNGLNGKYSQRLAPNTRSNLVGGNKMFGYMISKGVDIDDNLYNDIAIGSPNMEEVSIFRTYPVGEIQASLTPSKSVITKDDKFLTLSGCWLLQTKRAIKEPLDLQITLKADYFLNRAKWRSSNSTVHKLNSTISNQKLCLDFDVTVEFRLSDIFKPLQFGMEFDFVNNDLTKEEFCEKCYVLAPDNSNYTKTSVAFNTGCAKNPCVSDLKLTAEFVGITDNKYILGSTKTLPMNFKVTNSKEPAYLSILKVKINKPATFAKIPSDCKFLNDSNLECELNQGNPIKIGDEIKINIFISTSALEGNNLAMVVEADVSSSGEESHPQDNQIIKRLSLGELSLIEINGRAQRQSLLLKDLEDEEKIIHTMEIFNRGPSTIRDGLLFIHVPSFYKNIEVVNTMSIEIDVQYGSKIFHNQTSDQNQNVHQRTRRGADKKVKAIAAVSDLPVEKTVYFSCADPLVASACFVASFPISNFIPGNEAVFVNVSYTIKANTTEKLFDDKHDIVVFETISKITRTNGELDSIQITALHPFTVIFAKALGSVAWWVYLVSILAGVILLAVLTYLLYRFGFFKRKKKEELEEKKRESSGTEMQPLASNNN